MSTLRINNIEAKSVPASPTLDEKIKLTNSSGNVLVHVDGKTSGITTIGINTTAGNITFDANSNVVVTGIITATKFVGTIEPTDLTVSGDLTIPDKIIHSGDTNTAIRFPAADTITAETGGSERIRINSDGGINVTAGITTVQALQATTGTFSSDVSAATLTSTGNVTLPDSIIHTGDTDTKIRFPEDNKISFETAGTERLRIDNVGVLYTGNYSTTLDATPGSVQMSGGTAGARLSLRGSATGAGNGLAEIFAYWDTTKVAGMIAFAGEDTTNKDDGKLNFYTADGSGVQARMRISKEGYVTKPNQPSFSAYSTATFSHGSSTGVIDVTTVSNELFDTGGDYNASTNEFTAPVTGKYFFSFTYSYRCTSGYLVIRLGLNTGSGYASYGRFSAYVPQQSSFSKNGQAIMGVMPLNAGHKVRPQVEVNYAGNQLQNIQYSGYLLG